jgi:hypothetical protein
VTDVRLLALSLTLALGASLGCSTQPATTTAAELQAPTSSATASSVPATTGVRTVTGTVVETVDAKNYTYVHVNTGSEDLWAASGQFRVAVGDRVVVPLEMPMENFHSEALSRDFPLIYFASSITKEGQTPPPMAPFPGHPPMGGQAARPDAPGVSEPISPAPGGTRIADVWANRASLAGKTVIVRGKVVKFNGGIMGRNWVHIQDGSGKADAGTHDLTITTDAVVAVGDVITATGTLAVDKDFGAGYTYPVIVEGASIKAQ